MTLADPPLPPYYGILHNFFKKIFEPFPNEIDRKRTKVSNFRTLVGWVDLKKSFSIKKIITWYKNFPINDFLCSKWPKNQF